MFCFCSVEFDHLYHWHPLMPDVFDFNGTKYKVQEFMFNADIPLNMGLKGMVDSMNKQRAGKVGNKNNDHYFRGFSIIKIFCSYYKKFPIFVDVLFYFLH